ncbi:MAG TPA: hypothetical protein VJV79_19305 [Polyangiaceae bacterium]|nr:hypothetical protein [Polyangiaceae bacterium]
MSRARIRGVVQAVVRISTASFREPNVSLVFLVPALFALLYAACAAAVRIWYECHLPYNPDTSVYWAVGNGIVHGLTPWKDLFETKPAGIFLLSALSYRLLGNGHLTNVTQILSLLTIALSPAVYARRIWRARGNCVAVLPIFVVLWALVIDQASFVADYAGEVQTETHALPGLILYMLFLGARGRLGFACRTLGVLIAIGMKEPFVLAVPAVYLLLDPDTRSPWPDFFGPLALAGTIGAVSLLLVGWLPAYLGIYLKAMAGGHIQVTGSPWTRVAAALDNTWVALTQHSPLLPFVLLFLAAVYVFSPESPRSLDSRRVVLRLQALFLAMLLASLAVGLGGQFYPHHYMFATPVHLAILFALMASLARFPNAAHWQRGGLIGLVLICLLVPKWVTMKSFGPLLAAHRNEDEDARRAAGTIDAVLDRLKIDRYLWIGHPGRSPLPFTNHSPLGPLFFQQVHFFGGQFPWLASEFDKRLHEAKLLVLANYMTGPADASVKATIAAEYQPLPTSYLPKDARFPYELYIRRGVQLR